LKFPAEAVNLIGVCRDKQT